ALVVADVRVVRSAHELVFTVILNLGNGETVLVDPDVRMSVLGRLRLSRRGLNFPTSTAIDRFFIDQLVLELVGVALLEVFEAEVRAEESCGSILQCNPPLAIYRRCPHPLLRCPVRVVDDQQRDTLHLCRSRKSQYRLTRTV